MTAVAEVENTDRRPRSVLHRYYDVHPTYRLILRWALIVVLTGVAFHRSVESLINTTVHGGIGGYAWTVPMAATLVAYAVTRRKRTELPIHDRQTDIIVGMMGMTLAVLIQAVLLPRYALYFHVLRLDLIAMWLFVTCSAIMLFGLRPVIRFTWVWAMLLFVFALPYYLAVIALGGGNTAAGAATLIVASVGTGIAVGPNVKRSVIGSLAALVVGLAVLAGITFLAPDAPMLVYQQVPAIAAMGFVGLAAALIVKSREQLRVMERKVEPLAAKQVWACFPLVIAVAVVLATFQLPVSPNAAVYPRPSQYPLAAGMPLTAPAGWSTLGDITRYPVNRLYGADAILVRQRVTADVGNPQWDKLARPRTVVVDSTVSERPFSLGVYPSRVLYGLTSARISEIRPVNLGNGITGSLISVVDDQLLVTWNSLQFAWGEEDLAQRVTIFAVDNHEPDAPFPQPTQNLFPTLRTLVTLLFRGNAVLDERAPKFKDAEMLTQFARALIQAQIGGPQ